MPLMLIEMREENLLKGQSKCSTPTPLNQFPSRYRVSSFLFLNSPAETYTTPLFLRQVFDKFTSFSVRFCSRTHRNSFAHCDFNFIPVISSVFTVVFHPRAQTALQEPAKSSLYMRKVLFSGTNSTTLEIFSPFTWLQICTSMARFLAKTAEIIGVAITELESKIVNSFRVEFASIIFDNSSAPFKPIESSQICTSSRQLFTLSAEAISPAPVDPMPDSENEISFKIIFLLTISVNTDKHSGLNLFL